MSLGIPNVIPLRQSIRSEGDAGGPGRYHFGEPDVKLDQQQQQEVQHISNIFFVIHILFTSAHTHLWVTNQCHGNRQFAFLATAEFRCHHIGLVCKVHRVQGSHHLVQKTVENNELTGQPLIKQR